MGREREPGLLVITGPMFSEKTQRLIEKLSNRARYSGQKVLAFKPALDTRSGEGMITSHTGASFPAQKVSSSREILEQVKKHDPDLIGIDEAQFFDNELPKICAELMKEREVIVAGLNLDFRGEPFGPMPQILAFATDVVVMKALCVICGKDAEYSQRMVDGRPARRDDPIILVGGEEEGYEARCSDCFVKPN